MTSIQDDILQGKTCILIIDNQESQTNRMSVQEMSAYHEILPRFCNIMSDYAPVVHVAFTRSLKSYCRTVTDQDVYDKDNLRLRPHTITERFRYNSAITTDFLHPFNPETDLYLPKSEPSALGDSILKNFLIANDIKTVLVAGVWLWCCVQETLDDLHSLKNKAGILNHIGIIADLTDHRTDPNDKLLQITSIKNTLNTQPKVLFAQDIIDMIDPQLDLSLPNVCNQKYKRYGYF